MKEKTPSYIKVGIFTVITTILWIFFSVYRTLTARPTPNVPSQVLTPFSPTLDTAKISEIEARISFEEGQTSVFTVAPPTPTPEAEEEIPPEEPAPTETPIPEESQ